MAAKGKIKQNVGKAIPRVEDERLVKGVATYVDDMKLPGLLHAAVLRSPYAHAKIKGIDTAAAKAAIASWDLRPGSISTPSGANASASALAIAVS